MITGPITYGNALKAFRRGVHVNGEHWRSLVVSETAAQMRASMEEAVLIFRASSLPIATISTTEQKITFMSGASIRFRKTSDSLDAHVLAGHTYTQIIWLYDPKQGLDTYMTSMIRSPSVPEDQLRKDMSGL